MVMSETYKKYVPGEVIRDIQVLITQPRIFHLGRLVDKGWFQNWQLYYVLGQLQKGTIRYAVKEETNGIH